MKLVLFGLKTALVQSKNCSRSVCKLPTFGLGIAPVSL
jgi:hypothetical protein